MKFSPQLPYILTWDDLYLAPIYLLLIFLIIRQWRKRYTGSPLRKFIYPAVICKMAGCIFLALILNFYYGYGDTFSYYTGAHEIWTAFVKSPGIAGEIIFNGPKNYSSEALDYALHSGYTGFAPSYYVMFKVAGIIGLFCFGKYLPIAFIFSLLSFWGTWMIFLVFNEHYPHLRKYIAITTLFIPSLIMWTTGILKDPLCMFGLGICFYSLNNILKGKQLARNTIICLVGCFILLTIKDYIFYIFIAGACIWCYKTFIGHVSSTLIRVAIKGTLYLAFLGFIVYFINYDNNAIETAFTKYFMKAENLQNVMVTINRDYNSGSGYTLPTNDFSSGGIIRSFLLSINVSLFRPYLWECNSALMLLNFFESFVCMLLVIIVLFKRGPIGIYRALKDPLLLFSLFFSLVMAALVGFVSFNFGTLIRYKTPFEPFFYTMLVVILYNRVSKPRADVNGVLHPPVPPHLED